MSWRADVEALFDRERGRLWGACYRIVGTHADADEVLQEAFLRLWESPPADRERSLTPWLLKVVCNLARDRVRRRRARRAVGTWLPGPLEADVWESLVSADVGPERAAQQRESVRLACLHALERLTANQRAVWVLREALGCSVRETAEALGLSEPRVKTTLHRARRALARTPKRLDAPEQARRALDALIAGVSAGDVAAVVALLSPSARALSDSGGEFVSATRTIHGAVSVARFMVGIAQHHTGALRLHTRTLSDGPAYLVEVVDPAPGFAPWLVVRADLDATGAIAEVWWLSATRKLAGLELGEPPP